MIDPLYLVEELERLGIRFYAGVPDSLLKSFCACAADYSKKFGRSRYVIAANEGAAIALGAGHYLATNELACIYTQNSGLGNAINPLISLIDPAVFGIPLLLLVGWRGEPGRRDEPQHSVQGKKTISLLEALEIPFSVIDASTEIDNVVRNARTVARVRSCAYALVVREGTFKEYVECEPKEDPKAQPLMTREEAVNVVLGALGDEAVVISTTGMISREIFEAREHKSQSHDSDFLVVGSMGHASQIALGIAFSKSDLEVYCIDGDGAAIMHLGALALIGSAGPINFRHIIINNGAHDSVGGQPTAPIDFCRIATACGYKFSMIVKNAGEASEVLREIQYAEGPVLIEIKTKKGSRAGLGRPTISPAENKIKFMEKIVNRE